MPINSSNKSIIYPSGTTANRPTAVNNGYIYFNTTIGALQIYQNGSWYVLTNINAPGTPTSVIATDQGTGRSYNNGQMSIAFTPATETFGFPATYTITPTPTTSPATFTGTSSPIIVTGLASSTQYTYTVSATNNTGTSSASSASSGVTATTVPQAPTIGTATGADSSATLTFTAGSTGGATISNYKYSTDGTTYTAFSPAQTTSPLTISGLTNGNSYSFYLKAVNTNGDSSASSASNTTTVQIANAYESIATVYIASGTQAMVTFDNIPQGYKHLQIRGIVQNTATGVNSGWLVARLNNDSGANYSYHILSGYNASPSGGSAGSQTALLVGDSSNAGNGTYGPFVIDIADYSLTNKYKNTFGKNGAIAPTSFAEHNYLSGIYTSTNAITRIDIWTGSYNWNTYSHVALYGIKG